MSDPKATLVDYLQSARDALVWKLDGLDEYAARRPRTPTGSNLLGIVQHVAWVEAGYFGETFGRPFAEPTPWDWTDEATDPNSDFVVDPALSTADVLAFYRRVQEHAAATIDALPLEAPGHVPWWGERGDVTLHAILVHVVAEVDRHAGHADILREQQDGAVGRRAGGPNMPPDGYDWAAHVERVERAARAAGGSAAG